MIYISCPSNHATGGTELLHQLCHRINLSGTNCMMWYFDGKSNKHPTPERFRNYKCKYLIEKPSIQDPDILIVPETLTDLIYEFDKGKKCIWWLSVDFYKRTFKTKRYFIRRFLEGARFYNFRYKKNEITHIYQSEYAREYLINNGVNNIIPLSDYISDSFWSDGKVVNKRRKAVVLYNPKKGIKLSKKIIRYTMELDKDIRFVALENLSPAQMAEIMCESSVYIDFGNHPGKDRMPREAASMGCIVITGKEGSARNDIDVPIPIKYKFEKSKVDIRNAVELIIEASKNYEKYYHDFEEYRNTIAAEKEIFERQAKHLVEFLSQ